MDASKTEDVMSVELAICRELAYRKKLARLRSQSGNPGLDLMPLKVPASAYQVKPSNPTLKPTITENKFQISQSFPISVSEGTESPFLTAAQTGNPIPTPTGGLLPTPRPDAFGIEELALLGSQSGNPTYPTPFEVPSSSYKVKPSNLTSGPMITKNQFQSLQPSLGLTSLRAQHPISTTAQIQSPIPTPFRFQNSSTTPFRFQNPIPTPIKFPNAIPRPTQTSLPIPRPVPKQNHVQIPGSRPSYSTNSSTSFSSGPKRKGPVSSTQGQQFQKPKKSYPDCVIIHQEGSFYCNICEVPCSGAITLHQHLKGRKHKTQLQLVNSGKKVQPSGERVEVQTTWRCELCDIWCMNNDALQQHFKGKNHIIRLHAAGNGN